MPGQGWRGRHRLPRVRLRHRQDQAGHDLERQPEGPPRVPLQPPRPEPSQGGNAGQHDRGPQERPGPVLPGEVPRAQAEGGGVARQHHGRHRDEFGEKAEGREEHGGRSHRPQRHHPLAGRAASGWTHHSEGAGGPCEAAREGFSVMLPLVRGDVTVWYVGRGDYARSGEDEEDGGVLRRAAGPSGRARADACRGQEETNGGGRWSRWECRPNLSWAERRTGARAC
mmetsp:Transcript_8479/g.27718  ORF Transcript_8479/g.27718 Transcript_8479/m.27718 type:complete len:226 (-) Transcript_8479:38-715(-)